MDSTQLWQRYQRHLCRVSALGLALDISRMRFKDGFLDKEELRRAAARFRNLGQGKRPDQRGDSPRKPATLDFDALDLNADGRLTRDELKSTTLADKFDEIDANKDGKIDRKEFEAYLKKQKPTN